MWLDQRWGDCVHVRATCLKDNDGGIENFHDFGHDGLVQAVESGVCCAGSQWHIQRVELSPLLTNIVQRTSSREEPDSILVKADCHHPAEPSQSFKTP